MLRLLFSSNTGTSETDSRRVAVIRNFKNAIFSNWYAYEAACLHIYLWSGGGLRLQSIMLK